MDNVTVKIAKLIAEMHGLIEEAEKAIDAARLNVAAAERELGRIEFRSAGARRTKFWRHLGDGTPPEAA